MNGQKGGRISGLANGPTGSDLGSDVGFGFRFRSGLKLVEDGEEG